MKHNYLKSLLLLLAMVLLSCSKDTEDVMPTTAAEAPLVQQAKQSFDALLLAQAGQPDAVAEQGSAKTSRRRLLIKSADWARATTRKLSIGEAVEVPLVFPKELYAEARGSHTKTPLSQLAHLLLYCNAAGKWQAEVVTRLPDAIYLEGKDPNRTFTGTVLVEDWQGNFLRGFRYGPGEEGIQPIAAPQEVASNPSEKQVQYAPKECSYTDWYSCGGGECHYMYTESKCDSGGGGYGSGYSGGGGPSGRDYGGSGGSGSGAGYPSSGEPAAPRPPSSDALQTAIRDKPFVLLKDVPCELVKQWVAIAKLEVNATLKQKVNGLVGRISSANSYGVPKSYTYVGTVLDIDNAYSSVVNMDYFSVDVKTLPIINGQRATPQQFLNKIRTEINSFVDVKKSKFTPYNHYGVNDTGLWNSSNPTGAIVSIEIPGNSGSVIVSKHTSNNWTFSTLFDPYNGIHPVSGNREFGYTTNANGSYTFYTKGVDRLTDVWGTLAQSTLSIPFDQADALWSSFQNKISAYVNTNSGTASVNNAETYRPSWAMVKQVAVGIKPLSTLSNDCK